MRSRMPTSVLVSRIAPTLVVVALCAGCATAPPEPSRYRLSHSGTHWDVVEEDRVFEDLEPRYPEFFAAILDPVQTGMPNVRPLRDDLEHKPVDRRNYDALNSIAIAYFETNYQAEESRDDGGMRYLYLSQRSAQLLAVPWRAYGDVEEPALRDAILDFFDDAAAGEKLHSAITAPRLTRVVESLAKKESDPDRSARIAAMTATLEEKMRALEEAAGR